MNAPFLHCADGGEMVLAEVTGDASPRIGGGLSANGEVSSSDGSGANGARVRIRFHQLRSGRTFERRGRLARPSGQGGMERK